MIYGDILSVIHDEGFKQFSMNAYREITDHCDIGRIGVITDLGCGSGDLLKRFDNGNIELFGVDISDRMISIARSKVPSAELTVGSIYRYPIRKSDLVTAIGEVLNYLADDPVHDRLDLNMNNQVEDIPRNDVAGLFRSVYSALKPGGFFIFDVMLESETEDRTYQTMLDTERWTVISESAEDKGRKRVTRKIVSFFKNGECYYKSTETHDLQLYSETFLTDMLTETGFQATARDHYGGFPLGRGRKAFICSKKEG